MADDFWSASSVPGAITQPQQAQDFWSASSTPVDQGADHQNVDMMSDVAKGGATGLINGLTGIAGMPVDAINAARHLGHTDPQSLYNANLGLDSKGEPLGSDPAQFKADVAARDAASKVPMTEVPGGSQDVHDFVYPNGPEYQPQTGPGKFAELAGELAPAVATGTEYRTAGALGSGLLDVAKAAGGDARRILLPTLGAATGGEAADAVGLPKAVGEIPGQLIVRTPSLMLKNAERLVKDRIGGISPEEISAAKELQAKGQSVGVPLMGQESFNNLGLTQLSGDVAAAPTGSGPINSFLNARTGQTQAARGNMLDRLGPDIGPQEAGDTVNRAADQRLRDLGKMRSDVATPGYQAAAPASIPDIEAQRLEDSARTAAGQAGHGTMARSKLVSLADAIRENGSNIGLLDSTRKSFRDSLKNTALPDAQDSELRVLMSPVLSDMRDTMATNNQDFAKGLQASKEAAGIVEQVDRSPVGQVMAKTAEPAALTSAVGPARMNGPEVRDAFNELALANPQAPAVAARLFARNETNFPATPTAAMKIANALMGKPDTSENFQAMMRGSEFAGGQAPGTVSGPINSALSVFDATRRAPTINSATASRTLTNQQAGASPLGSLLETPITEPGQHFGQWLKSNIQRKTYADLARALTSPTSVEDLLKLSRQEGMTPAMRALISSGAIGAQSQTSDPKQ